MMGYYNNGMGLFGGLGMFLFLALIVLGTILFWRTLDQNARQNNGSKSNALDIAKERYAKGELSKDEFDRLKHDLV
jgi:putative membrane protein